MLEMILKLGGIPVVVMLMKAIGLPALVTMILNWDFIKIKQEDGSFKKCDLIDLVKVPAIKPIVASVVAGVLYMLWNCVTGEAFDSEKLKALLLQVSQDTPMSGAFSVLFYNVYAGVKQSQTPTPPKG